MGSMSIMHWLIVLVVIMLVFGTKRLTGAGSDIGKALKNFKDAVKGDDEQKQEAPNNSNTTNTKAQ